MHLNSKMRVHSILFSFYGVILLSSGLETQFLQKLVLRSLYSVEKISKPHLEGKRDWLVGVSLRFAALVSDSVKFKVSKHLSMFYESKIV